MLFAFLTTILFGFSAVFAGRSIRHLGSQRANFARLVVACGCLAALAHAAGLGLSGPAFWWFFVSGVVGFGIGDFALFQAFPRIGSRLTVLLTQCLAAPVAASAEWLWLGTRLTWQQAGCSALILAGVGIALAPGGRRIDPVRRAVFIAGLIAGIVSAIGQGLGASVSRKAFLVSEESGIAVDGVTAAYQRVLGGILFTTLALVPLRSRTPAANPATLLQRDRAPAGAAGNGRGLLRGWPWILANALAGPVFGVICFQQALATTPSGIVLPIVALTPIAVMPLAYVFEHDRPTRRAMLGGLVAVAGAVALAGAS